YLLPRQLAEHGLPDHALELTDAALRRVISEYTREAGVRTLERQLGTIARKVAAQVAGIDTTRKPAGLPLPDEQVTPQSGTSAGGAPLMMAFPGDGPGNGTGNGT